MAAHEFSLKPLRPPHPLATLLAELPRPIALAGCGVEGLETLRFLQRQRITPLWVFDQTLARRRRDGTATPPLPPEVLAPGVRLFDDEEWAQELPRAGTVFRTPGIRPDHPHLVRASQAGVKITSASTLFLQACPAAVVGVTGTLGKGTTATLIHLALHAAGLPSRLAGNIGLNPLAFLENLRPQEVVVLELSSFQLIDLGPAKPTVAVVLRTSQDHLDWHLDQAEYLQAKRGVLAGPPGPEQGPQAVVYCADSPGSREVVAEVLASRPRQVLAYSRTGPVARGLGMQQGRVQRYRDQSQDRAGPPLPTLERLALPGAFNLENAAAALLAVEALLAGVPEPAGPEPRPLLQALESAARAISLFPGLPHRLERVGEVGGVVCYNDSYATRPDATLGALSTFAQPLALILGGSEKHADFTELAAAVCQHPSLRQVLLIGATAGRLQGEIQAAAQRLGREAPPLALEPGLPEAVAHGLASLPSGGVLLLSPACASFGQFPNYKVRGERFQALVHAAQAGKEIGPL